MLNKVHPSPVPPGDGGSSSAETPATNEPIEEVKGQEAKTPSPAPVDGSPEIHHIMVSPLPPEPKSPSKPRQVGIGLDNLRSLDYLQIRQTNRHMEDFANVQNNYDVERRDGQKVFFGIESTAPDVRVKVQSSTNSSQPFALKLIDRDDGNELMEIERNGLNDAPTFVYKLRLRRKEPLAAISLQFGWRKLSPTLTIVDSGGGALFKLVGPAAASGLGKVVVATDTTFKIYKTNGDEVGSIVKDGDIFASVEEPITAEEIIRLNYEDKSLDVVSKALLLCAAFMLVSDGKICKEVAVLYNHINPQSLSCFIKPTKVTLSISKCFPST